MAVKKIDDATEAFRVEVNNGDLTALSDVVKKWKFKDKESALRFAIGVLSLTESGTLYQEKPDGTKAVLKPVDGIINN